MKMIMDNRLKKMIGEILAVIFMIMLSFIILMQSPLNFWSSGKASADSAVYKYVAMVMAKGGMPYKDAFDHKGPLIYIYNYIGDLISNYRGVWVIEFISMLLFLYSAYKTARLFCGRIMSCFWIAVAAAPLYSYLNGGNMVEEYALPFISVSLFIFIDYFIHHKVSTLRLLVLGGCFGAVLMLRANMISVWVVFCIGVLVWYLKNEKRIPWNFLLWFLAGAAVIILPILIWLACGGAFSDFIEDYILFNIKYSSSGLSEKYETSMFFLNSDLVLISIISMAYLIGRKINVYWNSCYLAYIAVTIYLLSISGRTYEHYGIILIPLFIYPLCSMYKLLRQDKNNTVFLYLAMVLLFIFPTWKAQLDLATYKLVHRTENIMSDQEAAVCQAVIDNTSENEKIIVIGNDDFYYIYLQRLASSRYSYQLVSEVDNTIADKFAADLANEPPKIVIVQDNSERYLKLFSTIENYDLLSIYDEGMAVYKIKENKDGNFTKKP